MGMAGMVLMGMALMVAFRVGAVGVAGMLLALAGMVGLMLPMIMTGMVVRPVPRSAGVAGHGPSPLTSKTAAQ